MAARTVVLALALLTSETRAADSAGMKAELSCRAEAAPGRVLCEVRYVALSGARLVWADALVTSAPAFVRPLRSRVSPERFGEASATERKLSLALVASHDGVGTVVVRARSVVCRGQGDGERCRPETQLVQTEIRVGG